MEATKPAVSPTASEPLPERYEEIVSKLSGLVERLEGGGMSLEDSVGAFEQGIRLARAGAAKLDSAEKRVEILLEGDRTQPFEPSRTEAPPSARPGPSKPRGRPGGGEDPSVG